MLKKETATPQENQIIYLEKQLKGLQMRITHEITPHLTDLRNQVETLKKGMTTLQNNQSDKMKRCIERQKRLNEEKPDSVVTNVTDRLAVLEDTTDALVTMIQMIGEGVADRETRMEDVEASIGASRLAIARIDVNDATETKGCAET